MSSTVWYCFRLSEQTAKIASRAYIVKIVNIVIIEFQEILRELNGSKEISRDLKRYKGTQKNIFFPYSFFFSSTKKYLFLLQILPLCVFLLPYHFFIYFSPLSSSFSSPPQRYVFLLKILSPFRSTLFFSSKKKTTFSFSKYFLSIRTLVRDMHCSLCLVSTVFYSCGGKSKSFMILNSYPLWL